MDDYIFLTVKELADKYRENPDKEIGFTNDDIDSIEQIGEATGWYGAKFTTICDGKCMIFGYYDYGIISTYNTASEGYSIVDTIIMFFKNEFGITLSEESQICVCKDDIE